MKKNKYEIDMCNGTIMDKLIRVNTEENAKVMLELDRKYRTGIFFPECSEGTEK